MTASNREARIAAGSMEPGRVGRGEHDDALAGGHHLVHRGQEAVQLLGSRATTADHQVEVVDDDIDGRRQLARPAGTAASGTAAPPTSWP